LGCLRNAEKIVKAVFRVEYESRNFLAYFALKGLHPQRWGGLKCRARGKPVA
jgi:hypothetical protein